MTTEEPAVLVSLPDDNREAFKAPLGPITTNADALFSRVDAPVLTIGDVVSFHALEAGRVPDVAVVDGRTKRSAVDPTIEETLSSAAVERLEATNPPGTITESLVRALEIAIEGDNCVQVVVDGEEDLAAIPAILLARDGATVVYGQPGEGMVTVTVNDASRERALALVALFDGDVETLRSLSDS